MLRIIANIETASEISTSRNSIFLSKRFMKRYMKMGFPINNWKRGKSVPLDFTKHMNAVARYDAKNHAVEPSRITKDRVRKVFITQLLFKYPNPAKADLY